MTVIRICGIVIISFVAVLVAKESRSSLGLLIPVSAFIIILLAIVPKISGEFGNIFSKLNDYAFTEYAVILTKALGISFVCGITSEICDSCGEKLLSNIAVFTGKIEILILSLPLVVSLLDIAGAIS